MSSQDHSLQPLLMGIDFGTTQIRASVYTPDGTLRACGKVVTPTIPSGSNMAHHEPDQVWTSTIQAVRGALQHVSDPSRIVGIACASVGEAGLLVDAAGEAISPIIAWYDRRAMAECRDFVDRLGIDTLYGITGQPAEPILGLYKLIWVKAHWPDLYARAAHWVNIADYLALRLSGNVRSESTLACRVGAFDLHQGTWATDILREARLKPSLFADLAPNGAPLGRISRNMAELTGLPTSCMVAVGGHDQALSALVCSGFREGILSATLGTTEALVVAIANPSRLAELGRQGFCQGVVTAGRRHNYILGGVFTAGASIEWFRQTVLDGLAHEHLVAAAAAVPAGSRGACFQPQLLLGSAPHPDPHPNGAFWGLSLAADRGTLFRAILEGLAYEARLCADALTSLPEVASVQQINAVGGDTRNALRLSIKASVSGVPIDVLGVDDAAGLGAALMAGLGAGVYPNLDSGLATLVLPRKTVLPIPEDHAFYDNYFRSVYKRASSALSTLRKPEVSSSSENVA